jgi:hypothetical protein
MYLDNLFGASNYLTPYQWGTLPTANGNAGNAAPVISTRAPTPVSAAKPNSDQVTLSDAAQALQAPNGASTSAQSGASTDFAQEQQMLTTLTDKSLAALGIISTADEANTKISFDSLSYQVSSSATASVAQQGTQSGAAIGATEDATFTGEGHIVTPDGTQYTFQVSLELDQSAQAASISDSGSGNSGAGTAGNNSVGSATQQPSNLLAQLVNALGFSAPSPGAPAATSSNPPGKTVNGSANASTQSASPDQSGQSGSSTIGINWDAILKQTASLFDLLDSINTPAQASAHAPGQTGAQTVTQTTGQTPAAA